jgi:hypothetical protein
MISGTTYSRGGDRDFEMLQRFFGSSRVGTSSRALRMRHLLSATACSAALGSLIAALAAAAAGGTIGSITLSGQLAGSLKLLTTTPGVDGIPLYGCQAQQGGTAVLLNFPNVKIPLNGHVRTMKAIEADVSVKKTGVTERASGPDNQITFSVEVGTTNYNWGSTSGTLKMSADGDGGSFSAALVPKGSLPGGVALQSGGATKPVRIAGSWSTCHPYVP